MRQVEGKQTRQEANRTKLVVYLSLWANVCVSKCAIIIVNDMIKYALLTFDLFSPSTITFCQLTNLLSYLLTVLLRHMMSTTARERERNHTLSCSLLILPDCFFISFL